MAQTTGTTTTHSVGTAGGNREDLEDKIWDLFAEDTWALSNLEHTMAEATYHEWMLDSLASAASNTAVEGNDPTYSTVANATRVGNYCQITQNNFLVSRTQEKVAKAGVARASARQAMKKMRELKNDMEYDIVRNHASSAGSAAAARVSGGMESWIATNVTTTTTSTAASSGGFVSGIVQAPVDATESAASEGVFKGLFSNAWSQGGNASIVLANTSTKAVIDGFTGIVTRNIDMSRSNPQEAAIIGASNVYVSSYGVHTIKLHRHVRGATIMALDPEYWAVAFLDTPFMEELAKTGDARKFMLSAEWCLVSRNEAASAKLVGVQ